MGFDANNVITAVQAVSAIPSSLDRPCFVRLAELILELCDEVWS